MTTETYFYSYNHEVRTVTRAPKQRLLHLHLVCADGHKSINYNAHIKARANLTKNAFQLYDYLEFISDGLVWSLSSSNVYKETDLTEQTYAKAFKELIEKGYIVKQPITITTAPVFEDAYHFYEDPDLASKVVAEAKHPLQVNKPTINTNSSKTTPAEPSTPIAHSCNYTNNAYPLIY